MLTQHEGTAFSSTQKKKNQEGEAQIGMQGR